MLGTSDATYYRVAGHQVGNVPTTFQEDHEACQHWVTHSWMKLVWEKAHHLWVKIDIANLPVHPPQERDLWLIKEFVQMNYNSDDLRRLNRVWLHQEYSSFWM